MILPGHTNCFEGVIGGTFDTIVTLYQGVAASIWGGLWVPAINYQLKTVVIGSDDHAYISTIVSQNVNPVGDVTGHWSALATFDLSGYTALFQINPPDVTPSASDASPTLGGSAGTVSINVSATEMAAFTADEYPCYLRITSGTGDVYFPIISNIRLVDPI